MSEKDIYQASPKALDEEAVGHTAQRTSVDTIDTISDPEVQRENVRNGNPNGFARTTSGIDVKAAEEEFATLQRELSGISQMSRRLSKTHSKNKVVTEKDVEKTASSEETGSEEEPFDLETTLRGNHTVSGFIKLLLLPRIQSINCEAKMRPVKFQYMYF
jgi:ATP-binding cassette subfamily G (WHITE) protein 2 (SNQ2)